MFWDQFALDEEKSSVVPELCLSFLNNSCALGNQQCSDIHTKYAFLWQSEVKGDWCNLPEFHSNEIELAYRTAHTDGINLSPVDAITSKEYFDPTRSWYVNFDKMSLDQDPLSYKIRRLSTPSSVISSDRFATDFEWYFKDERSRWILYGRANPNRKQGSATTTTSVDLERKFCQSSVKQMTIASTVHSYLIDFEKMTQMNTSTSVTRPIRRRVKTGSFVVGSGPASDLSPETGTSKTKAPAQNEWQFQDENGAWITYGNSNSAGDMSCVTTTTSDIEKHCTSNPLQPAMNLQSNSHQYVLDFQAMTQTNQQTKIQRPIRKIAKLISSSNVSILKPAVTVQLAVLPTMSALKLTSNAKFPEDEYEWFFKDENNSWVKYGELNSLKKRDCVTMVTSDDIEEQYKYDPNKCMVIESQQHKYLLDFVKMTQTNKETRVERAICRKAKNSQAVIENASLEWRVSAAYEWYFLDENDCWVKYGMTHAYNSSSYGTTTSSDDLERHFNQSPKTPLKISSQEQNYTVDFIKMIQTNTSTNVERPVCRRAKILSITNGNKAPVVDTIASLSTSGHLPSYWSATNDSSTPWSTVPLSTHDAEYSIHISFMKQTLPSFTVQKMYRVQNPFLWKAYVNKKDYMMQQCPGIKFKEEYLFHGTDQSNVKAICEENIDWRLHGMKTGQLYGRGSYFSNCPKLSSGYTSGPSRVLFIVKVLIGHTTKGDSNTVKPPKDGSGRLCDTTVDDVNSPKIFVKYDSQEYYPEYYVEFH